MDGSEERSEAHIKYRLSYIQDDEVLSVSPGIVRTPPDAPRYRVHYRLLPPVSRGMISAHFSEMRIQYLADGSAEIEATWDNPWEAGKTLLTYGEFCVVLGGDEVRAWMERTVQGMSENYGKTTEDPPA